MKQKIKKIFIIFLSVIVTSLATPMASAASLDTSTNRYRSLNNIPFTSSGQGCSTGELSAPGSDIQISADQDSIVEAILKFYTGKGFSLEQAAGIAGNVYAESSYDPRAENAIGAFGLMQWLGGRRANLEALAAENNVDKSDVAIQLKHSWIELNTDESATLVYYASNMNMTIDEATQAWMDKFERPSQSEKDESIGRRKAAAHDAFNKFKGKIESGKGIEVDGLQINTSSPLYGTVPVIGCITSNPTTCTPHNPIGYTSPNIREQIFGGFEDESQWVPVDTFMGFSFASGAKADGGAYINKKAEPCLRAVENELKALNDGYKVRMLTCSRLGEGQPEFYHGYAAACDINWDTNGFVGWPGTNYTDLPAEWVAVFKKYGWHWGGEWVGYDYMHFEYHGDESDKGTGQSPTGGGPTI